MILNTSNDFQHFYCHKGIVNNMAYLQFDTGKYTKQQNIMSITTYTQSISEGHMSPKNAQPITFATTIFLSENLTVNSEMFLHRYQTCRAKMRVTEDFSKQCYTNCQLLQWWQKVK